MLSTALPDFSLKTQLVCDDGDEFGVGGLAFVILDGINVEIYTISFLYCPNIYCAKTHMFTDTL